MLVATRSLPERYDIPLRYSESPEPYAASLIACCRDTAQKAGQVAETGYEIAGRVRAPSRTLVTLRAAAWEEPESRPPADPGHGARTEGRAAAIGPVESRLRSLGIENQRHLWQANAIDRTAEQLVREASAHHVRLGPVSSARASFGTHAQASASAGTREARARLQEPEAEP